MSWMNLLNTVWHDVYLATDKFFSAICGSGKRKKHCRLRRLLIRLKSRKIDIISIHTKNSQQHVTTSSQRGLACRYKSDLLEDLVDVDLIGLHGLALLLAGPSGLLHHLLGSGCLLCWSLDCLLTDLGSHCARIWVCECLSGRECVELWCFWFKSFELLENFAMCYAPKP